MTLKICSAAIILMISGYSALAQDCHIAYKDGSKFTSTAYSWTNPHLYDPKFQKLKDEKKDELISKYNNEVQTGKIQPTSTYPMVFSVKRSTLNSGGEEYTLTTSIGGKDYSSYLICKGDTMFSYRNKGIVELNDAKGASIGFTIQSPSKIPMKLKVGDKLPTFSDLSFLNPVTAETRAKYIQMEGDYMVSYSLKALETLSFSSNTIHHVFAEVTGEEELTIHGTKYQAYIIESEKWHKGKMDISTTTAYSDVNEAFKKGEEKLKAKAEKMMIKKGVTNDLGYMVSYLKEWFVPALGIVKTESYDNSGGIAGASITTDIE